MANAIQRMARPVIGIAIPPHVCGLLLASF
jgi:hypothetical protein